MLCRHVETLFCHIYGNYEDIWEVEEVIEESVVFEWEKPYIERDRYKWMLEDKEKELEDAEKELEASKKKLKEKDKELEKLRKEIARLKKENK